MKKLSAWSRLEPPTLPTCLRIHSIYSLEKEVNQRAQARSRDAEASPLLDTAGGDPNKAFAQALDHELYKIESFYRAKEGETFYEVDVLLKDKAALLVDLESLDGPNADSMIARRRFSSSRTRKESFFREWGFPGRRRTSVSRPMMERIESDDSDEEADEHSGLKRSKTQDSDRQSTSSTRAMESSTLRRRPSAGLENESDIVTGDIANVTATVKKRMTSLYVALCELKSYVQLNKTGFSKVLKKYDKTLDKKLKAQYIPEKISTSEIFKQATTDGISDRIARIEQAFAELNNSGDIDEAKRELRLDLREHVVWERNTVWREMIGIERKAQAANLGIRQTILGGKSDQRQGDEASDQTKEVMTPVGRYRCPSWLFNRTFYVLVLSLIVFAVLLSVPIMKLPEQQNCLAMVIFVSMLWATEASICDNLVTHAQLTSAGDTTVRHVASGPFPGGRVASCQNRRLPTRSSRE